MNIQSSEAVINVDESGKPLRPAILWLDQRKTHGLPPVGGLWGGIFGIAGRSATVNYIQAESEANWISNNQPEVWQKTHKYLLLSGYLTYKLVGRFVDSVGCQVGYIPFDYKRLRWSARWNWKWKILSRIDPEILPELIPPGQILGRITADAANETGIPQGLPLVAAAADKACEVIGSGSLESSIGCLSYGTTATINVTHKKYVEPIPLIPPYPAAVPGYHTLEVQVFRGYWMVNWFKEEFGHPEKQQALEMGFTPEALFDRLIDEIPPGSMGLMLQPYWTPGLKLHPDFKTAVGAMTHVGEAYEPDQTNHRVYEALFHDVYKKMYKRLKPLYRRIMEITGYPK